jgi:hypothetical protein
MRAAAPLILALLLLGCRRTARAPEVARIADSPATAIDITQMTEAVRDWNLKRAPAAGESGEVTEISIIPFEGRPDLCGSICGFRESWCKFFAVYGVRNGAIEWQADCDKPFTDGVVHALRSVRLSGFENPVFEVYGMTHMGNGSLYLYELQGRRLVPVLQTWAVDFHTDRFTLRNGVLVPTYRDIDLNGFDDVELVGTVVDSGEDIYDPDPESKEGIIGKGPSSEFPCRKLLFWNPALHAFVENEEYRTGRMEY